MTLAKLPDCLRPNLQGLPTASVPPSVKLNREDLTCRAAVRGLRDSPQRVALRVGAAITVRFHAPSSLQVTATPRHSGPRLGFPNSL